MSKRRCNQKNCTLLTFEAIRLGLGPSKVKGFSKRQIQNVLNQLRRKGLIKKIGYGVWETTVDRISDSVSIGNKVQLSHHVAKTHTPSKGAPSDHVRGHGIVVTLKIPADLRGWESRAQALTRAGIPWEKINQGQRVAIGNVKKVWLTNISIVYYLGGWSWYGETAPEVAWKILEDVLKLIRRTERTLGISSLKIQGMYQIKFSRQHYALIKNALAIDYNKRKEKLFVYDEHGLWLLIDNSRNLHELEFVHPKTAVPDTVKVDNFFNDLKKNPTTPSEILGIMGKMANEQQQYRGDLTDYGKNIAAHGRSMDSLATSMKELTGLVKQLAGRRRQTRLKEHI